MTETIHKHIWKRATESVTLDLGKKTAVDLLKQLKCKCGKVITYDLERSIK